MVTLGELARYVGGRLTEGTDAQLAIVGINTVERAREGEVCFIDNKKYLKQLAHSKASAVLLSELMAKQGTWPSIIVENPKWAFAKIMGLFYPDKTQLSPGIHPSVVIGKNTVIDPSASIGAYCVLGDNCHIGPHTILHPHVTLYSNTTIGSYSIIHSGAILGGDGFGYAQYQEGWFKIPHIGGLRIGDRVEIGANTTIDRGMIEDTVIHEGVIIDNQVHIAHNVEIGYHTAIAACVGIAGSAKIGRHCQIGGGSIINGHISIIDHTYLIPGSQVANSIKNPGIYSSGIPAKAYPLWIKNVARFHQLDEMADRLKRLENKLKEEI